MSHEIQDIKKTAEIVYFVNDGMYALRGINKETWKKNIFKKLWHCSGYVTFLKAFCESCEDNGWEEVLSQNINLFASWMKLNKLNKRSHKLKM